MYRNTSINLVKTLVTRDYSTSEKNAILVLIEFMLEKGEINNK